MLQRARLGSSQSERAALAGLASVIWCGFALGMYDRLSLRWSFLTGYGAGQFLQKAGHGLRFCAILGLGNCMTALESLTSALLTAALLGREARGIHEDWQIILEKNSGTFSNACPCGQI